MADTPKIPETSEYERLYAAAMAIRANPPARNPVKVALLFNQDDAPATSSNETELKMRKHLNGMQSKTITELRDALADAYSQIGVLEQRNQDLQCALLSAQGGQP